MQDVYNMQTGFSKLVRSHQIKYDLDNHITTYQRVSICTKHLDSSQETYTIPVLLLRRHTHLIKSLRALAWRFGRCRRRLSRRVR